MSSTRTHQMKLRSTKQPKLTADSLPDEIWRKVFELGIENSNYTLKDISSLLISCKLFNRLWDDDSLWSLLLTIDFPQQDSSKSPHSSCKRLLYKHSLARYCKSEFVFYQRQLAEVQSRIGFLWFRMTRLWLRIKARSRRLEGLVQKWRDELEKGMQAVARRDQSHLPSVAPTTSAPTTISICAPSTTALPNSSTTIPASDPSAASPTSAPSLSTPTDHISVLNSLIGLKTKIDEVVSFQQDKISKYIRQRAQICGLIGIRQDHYTQLQTLTSCLASLSSGCNPINIHELEVDDIEDDGDEGGDDDNNIDDDVEDEDDFDYDFNEDDINDLPAE